jgi:tetratricopeptide (TPR) repeat protein
MTTLAIDVGQRVFNPFVGLRPFEEREAHLFFGRDGQSDEIVSRLARKRFVAVVGVSGSGKSSLVRAGLFPGLRGGFMASAGSHWRIACLRPGSAPIASLAESLHGALRAADDPADVLPSALIEATLRRTSLGVGEVVRQALLAKSDNVLVVVDQFEELFRYKRVRTEAAADDDAAAFVKLLIEAPQQAGSPIYVMLTMRSDFLGDCAQFRGLPEMMNDSQYLIPRMNRDERRQAIEGPIGVGGARISPRLVQRLLNDVGEDPDQLPVLQHALMRTWQHWERHRGERPMLDLDDYEAIGTMSEALSRDADEAYAEIGDERGRGIAEMLFKRLTERGKDARETRRPTRFDELCAVAGAAPGEVTNVIDRFRDPARSFLMPAFDVPLRDDSIVDISHESLIRKWKRLDKWVSEEGESRAMYQRIADAAERFRSGKGGLWGNPDLKLALDWFGRAKPNAAWATRYGDGFAAVDTFLRASKRKELIRRGIVPLIFVLALIAGYAVLDNQRTREETERAKAETSRLKAIERIVLEGLTYQLPQLVDKARIRPLGKDGDVKDRPAPEVLELERQIFQQNLQMLQKMIASVGADQASVRELAMNWLQLSDVLLAQNDLPGAHDAVRRAEPLIREVIASAPSDPNWQRDLSIYHQQMGDVLVAQNDLPGALREYRADLAIVRALQAADPASPRFQRDVSVAHVKLGDALLEQGEVADALAEYRLDLEIAERLAHADPSKASLQDDLATSHERIADALTRVGKATEAADHLQSARKIRETLATR